MSSSDSQSDEYEEEQVLWGKIRGYPWWPAFVDKVHLSTTGQTQYTVFFFGDYTYSRLGASKLRKFYEHYTECYQLARTHRKLMASIQMAEDKLQQNDQDVEIFEELRNELKTQNREHSRRRTRKNREVEYEMEGDKNSLPQLKNVKTSGQSRGRGRPKKVQKEEKSDGGQSLQNRRSIRKPYSPSSEKKKIQQQSKQGDEQEEKKARHSPRRRGRPRFAQTIKRSQSQVPVAESEVQGSQSEDSPKMSIENESAGGVAYDRKLRNSLRRKQVGKPGPGRRGRPKKSLPREEEKEKQIPLIHPKRKIIRKRGITRQVELTSTTLSEEDTLIVQKVKQLMQSREELINYLNSQGITVHNVQEILELGVATILEDGERTAKSNEVLSMLRNALLYKYFPNDTKHKKEYEKIVKRRQIAPKNDEKIGKVESEQMLRSNQEIRRKTKVKLEKFLKVHPDSTHNAKEVSIKIESYFEQADASVEGKYKSIALKVLSALKEGKESPNELIRKLEHHEYD